MTDFRNIFLDTSPIIYCLDDDENFGEISINLISGFIAKRCALTTSAITYTEYLVHPYRTNNIKKINDFKNFIKTCGIYVKTIDETVAEKAARIRARYEFKGMDALQLAAAVTGGCDVFLTNDKQLKRFDEITVLAFDDLEK